VKDIAKWRESGGVFKQSPKVKTVYYRDYQAIRIMKLPKKTNERFGGMVSFTFVSGKRKMLLIF
jgi:cystathionine beta-lyase/cystathionine gamma-synthase